MRLRGITPNVKALGWVSFFTDLASEMLYPIMPLFLVGTLHTSAAALGIIDGLAEGISSGLRWIGGALSDRFRRRKPFVFAGYLASAFSKPLMGLAAVLVGWPLYAIGRCADRLGKSIRTSARDALIADSTDPAYRGAAFGFHRSMDTAGAVLGPLVALALLIGIVGLSQTFSAQWMRNDHALHQSTSAIQKFPLEYLFYFAAIPGLISAWLIVRNVREIPPAGPQGCATPPPIFQAFPRPFWLLILANAVFSLGNSSDAFLILRSGEIGLAFGHIVLAFALYNTTYAIFSAPLGRLSDRIGRKPVIIAGWLTYAAVYAGFAIARSPLAPWILFAAYGLYQGLSEGVSKAMISDLVPSHQRAGAIGLFYTVSGFGQLAASIVAGLLWNVRLADSTVMAPFALGAAMALLAIPLIAAVPITRPPASVGE